jgi:hypothetical protein
MTDKIKTRKVEGFKNVFEFVYLGYSLSNLGKLRSAYDKSVLRIGHDLLINSGRNIISWQ